MPNSYLDRLHRQADEITQGIDALVERAAAEDRDVNETEQQQVDRDQARLTELQQSIQHYTDLETRQGAIAELRQRVRPTAPSVTRAAPEAEPEYSLTEEFPTIGHYAIAVHRAMVLRDPEAQAQLERATQHQLLADNPGIVPKPVLGPVLNLIDGTRPFINSCTRKALPAGKFDRPYIDQHVAVEEQPTEKFLTASQKMTIQALEVTAHTFAGHLNISRQDIKWTSPGILQIVYDDFATVYAIRTCDYACDSFVAGLTGAPVNIPTWDAEGLMGAIYGGAAAALAAGAGLPDTMWCAPDVWGRLGGMVNSQGAMVFPGMSVTSQGGNPMGLSLVVDQHLPAGFLATGPSRLLEWYEDVDGLMQVGEPDVLGQLVGYAGYGAFLNVAPDAFVKYTVPAPV